MREHFENKEKGKLQIETLSMNSDTSNSAM